MKRFLVLALLIASSPGWTQNAAGPKPVVLMEGLVGGLSTLHHPVSTKSPEAQQFFDQGLRLVYAFNHEEAARSFRRAAELDPHLAMAWWGVALAVGPNYNLPVDPEHEKIAVDAVDQAKALSAGAPQIEKDYIAAMANALLARLPIPITTSSTPTTRTQCANSAVNIPMTSMPPRCSPTA